MYIILTYDVSQKRVSKTGKVCSKYLHRVQNSVFEGELSFSQKNRLEAELKKLINPKQDSITLYCLESTKFVKKEEIGILRKIEEII